MLFIRTLNWHGDCITIFRNTRHKKGINMRSFNKRLKDSLTGLALVLLATSAQAAEGTAMKMVPDADVAMPNPPVDTTAAVALTAPAAPHATAEP